jgi:hypothetical protein
MVVLPSDRAIISSSLRAAASAALTASAMSGKSKPTRTIGQQNIGFVYSLLCYVWDKRLCE